MSLLLIRTSLGFYADQIHGTSENQLVGSDFWFGALPSAYNGATNITLIVTNFGEGDLTAFTVSTKDGFRSYFPDSKSLSANVTLSGSLIPKIDSVSESGVIIDSLDETPILVQLLVNSDIPNSSEGTILWPISFAGDRYILNGMYPYEVFTISLPYCSSGMGLTITFTNGTQENIPMNYTFKAYSFSGSNLTGTIINSSCPVSVFGGYTRTNKSNDSYKTVANDGYLWEQLAPISKFDRDFIFVNPSGLGSNSTLYLLNGEESPVQVNISGSSPFLLNSYGTATVIANNLSHSIHSNGSIDIQVVSGSLLSGNRTQFGLVPNTQFGSASKVNDNYFAFYAPGDSSLIVIIARTSDIQNQTSRLEFGQGIMKPLPFYLKGFQLSADPSYSFAFYRPMSKQITMFSNFYLAAYLFSSSTNGINFGSYLIRS